MIHHPDIKPSRKDSLFYKIMFPISLVGPVMTLPQLFQIFQTKNVEGLNLSTWLSYWILSIFWLYYSIMRKSVPVFLNSIACIFIQLAIIIGIILYKK